MGGAYWAGLCGRTARWAGLRALRTRSSGGRARGAGPRFKGAAARGPRNPPSPSRDPSSPAAPEPRDPSGSAMVCGGFACSRNALCALNVVYVVSGGAVRGIGDPSALGGGGARPTLWGGLGRG